MTCQVIDGMRSMVDINGQARRDAAAVITEIINGRAGIDAMVAQVHAAYPGYRFRRTSEVDGHHDQIRFNWELAPEGGPLFVAGVDFAVVAGEKLAAVTGFFDQVNQPSQSPSP